MYRKPKSGTGTQPYCHNRSASHSVLENPGDTCLFSWESVNYGKSVVILENVSLHYIGRGFFFVGIRPGLVNKWRFTAYLSWRCRCMFVLFQQVWGNVVTMETWQHYSLVYHYRKYHSVSRVVWRPVEVVDWVDEKAANRWPAADLSVRVDALRSRLSCDV